MNRLISICSGLEISGPEKRLLTFLWEIEKNGSMDHTSVRLEKLRDKVKQKSSKMSPEQLPVSTGWEYVYASLGTLEKGASLSEILEKNRLSIENCKVILDELAALKVVSFCKESNRFYASGLHLLFDKLTGAEKKLIGLKIKEAEKALSSRYGRDDSLFQYYFFSIEEAEFQKLRKRLKYLLDEFADDSESGNGARIVEMQVSFLLKN